MVTLAISRAFKYSLTQPPAQLQTLKQKMQGETRMEHLEP